MAAQILASIGHYGFHGLSAAFDFSEAIGSFGDSVSEQEPLRILLVSPGDIRHIIATIARRRRLKTANSSKNSALRPIHFYLLESPIEALARDILLLELISDYEVPIRQRATVFLEIFGNCKVQDRTSRYIEQLGHQLRSLVAHGTGRLEDIVDLSMLRYRERDDLETAFKNYSRGVPFDVETLRDHRLRGLYGDRYDNRKALADWDYHNNIKAKASIIHIKQYKEWCHSGTAFEFGDQTYTEPNRTMMAYAEGVIKAGKEKGLKKEVRGLWTDVVASPYFSFGVDCETPNAFSEGLFEIYNKNSGSEQHRHHTVEVAIYTVLSYLWEIETGQVYRMTKAHDVYSGLGAENDLAVEEEEEEDFSTEEITAKADPALPQIEEGEERVVELEDGEELPGECSITAVSDSLGNLAVSADAEDKESAGSKPVAAVSEDEPSRASEEVKDSEEAMKDLVKQIQRAECIAESTADVKVFPLLGSPSILDKPKYSNYFDGIFVSARSAQCVEAPFFKNLLRARSDPSPAGEGARSSTGSLVAIETAKFLVPLSKKLQAEFNRKEEEYATAHGWAKTAPPVPRRRRDELDLEDDVVYFRN